MNVYYILYSCIASLSSHYLGSKILLPGDSLYISQSIGMCVRMCRACAVRVWELLFPFPVLVFDVGRTPCLAQAYLEVRVSTRFFVCFNMLCLKSTHYHTHPSEFLSYCCPLYNVIVLLLTNSVFFSCGPTPSSYTIYYSGCIKSTG